MDDDEDWSQLGGDAGEVGETIDALARCMDEVERRSAAMVAGQQFSPLRSSS